MVNITFNDQPQEITTIQELGDAIDRFDQESQFEIWANVQNGPAMCMLRSGSNSFLMYLREAGDSGFTSRGTQDQVGNTTYLLSNGQLDDYPRSWSIDVEQCYKAISYFFVNGGTKPDWIHWHED
ncbi:Imm1 family immunity protein [Sapientia aquatica]|uniref:Uncharacterized protein n=1 Tax=Sapientia aquatica TaxID=1549640 RepID=A0A4V3AUV5_9BURK|nr:Imm1 family immunity protein [Sapientia aquatica]TDK66400.1 hypothetical protein E2I14_07960 [Sapientia aquatica]